MPRKPNPEAAKLRDDVAVFIQCFWVDNFYSPSIREICAAFGGLSTSHAVWILDRLEMEGIIKRAQGKNRTIVPIEIERAIRGVKFGGL